MSVSTRVYIDRSALVAGCAGLDEMFEYKRFCWVQYRADVEYIVSKMRMYGWWKDAHFYEMLDAFQAALADKKLQGGSESQRYLARWTRVQAMKKWLTVRNWDALFLRMRHLAESVTQKLRHPFKRLRHA